MMSAMHEAQRQTDMTARDGDWPAWTAPLALVGGFVLAAVAQLIVDGLAGVSPSAAKPPGGVEIAGTLLEEICFVLAAVFCARIGGRHVRSWQFGLRRPRLGRALLGVFLTLVVFLLFTEIWASALNVSTKEHLLEQLGSHEAASLLILSAVLTTVVAPICEELLFRGFVFTALRKWAGTLPAAVLTGVLFGLAHAARRPSSTWCRWASWASRCACSIG